jgi:preprotein translocase subunit SecD
MATDSPAQINKAADALVNATQDAATSSGQQAESDLAVLAPGLAHGSNAPGGYNYQANIAPEVSSLTDQYVVNAKQAILKNAVRDALNNAQINYTNAQNAYDARQRKFNQEKAAKERQRQAEQERRYQQAKREREAARRARRQHNTSVRQALARLEAANRQSATRVGGVHVVHKRRPAVPYSANPQPAAGATRLQNAAGGNSLQLTSGASFLQNAGTLRLQ